MRHIYKVTFKIHLHFLYDFTSFFFLFVFIIVHHFLVFKLQDITNHRVTGANPIHSQSAFFNQSKIVNIS